MSPLTPCLRRVQVTTMLRGSSDVASLSGRSMGLRLNSKTEKIVVFTTIFGMHFLHPCRRLWTDASHRRPVSLVDHRVLHLAPSTEVHTSATNGRSPAASVHDHVPQCADSRCETDCPAVVSRAPSKDCGSCRSFTGLPGTPPRIAPT